MICRAERKGKTFFIDGPGWANPKDEILADYPKDITKEVEGNFVGFSSSFPINYGHLIHDHLPVVAWLISIVPPTTRFILHYDPDQFGNAVSQQVYGAVDSSFLNRVLWVKYNEIVHVKNGVLGRCCVVCAIAQRLVL